MEKSGDAQWSSIIRFTSCIENAAKLVVDSGRKELFKTQDYRDFLTLEGVDAIMAYTSWDIMHTEVCIAAMKAGISHRQ